MGEEEAGTIKQGLCHALCRYPTRGRLRLSI